MPSQWFQALAPGIRAANPQPVVRHRKSSFVLGLALHALVGLAVVVGSVAAPGLEAAAWAAPADDRAARIARLEASRARLDGERRGLEQQLGAKTQEVASLKKQRPSWSRDQKLDVRLREAKDLAGALDRKAEQIRGLDAQLRAERTALVEDVSAELALQPAPTAARAAQLGRWQKDAERALGGPRRIEVTDEDMSPLDDPEDLDEKAGTLADSEARLRGEEARLERRATYFRKQAKLQRARQRDKEQDLFDDEPRRGGTSSSRGVSSDSTTPDAPAAAPPPSSAGSDSEHGGGGIQVPPTSGPADSELGEDASAVYADVVDPGTLVELQRAERSGDPENKAKAAERALRDVRTRADRLRAKRLEMEKRARQLREQGN
jgi:hypothetical protein